MHTERTSAVLLFQISFSNCLKTTVGKAREGRFKVNSSNPAPWSSSIQHLSTHFERERQKTLTEEMSNRVSLVRSAHTACGTEDILYALSLSITQQQVTLEDPSPTESSLQFGEFLL